MSVSFCPFVGPFEDHIHLDPKTLFKEYDEMIYCSRYELKKDGIVYDIDFDQDQVVLKFKRLGKKVLELKIYDDDLFWVIKAKNLDKEAKMIFKKFVNSLDYLFIFPYYIFFFDFLKTYNGTVVNGQVYLIEQGSFKDIIKSLNSKELLNYLKNERSVPVFVTLDNDLVIDGSTGFIEFKDENILKSFKEDVFEYFDKVYKESKVFLNTFLMIQQKTFFLKVPYDFKKVVKYFENLLELLKITRDIYYGLEYDKSFIIAELVKGDEHDMGKITYRDGINYFSFAPCLSYREFVLPYTYEICKIIEKLVK